MATRNCSSPYDAPEYVGVTVASVVSAFVSFAASAFVIFLILFFKRWKVLVQRLIFFLSIATLLNGVALMLHRVDYDRSTVEIDKENFCVVAGFLEQQTGWMQLDAVVCITVHLFLCAVLNVRLEKLEWVYISGIFIVPLFFNWIPFINIAYGQAGAWCWIRDRNDDCSIFEFGRVLQFVLWYVPLYLILLLLIVLYIFILYKLHRTRSHWVGRYDPTTERIKEQTRTEVAPLIWYPVIYVVLNLFPLINRIHNFAYPSEPNIVLWYLHAITYPLTGAFVALPFLLDKDTRKTLHLSSFQAAARELCQKDDSDVREYTIGKSEETVEEKQMVTMGDNSSHYNSFKDKQ